ncbi:hypothetical protein [Nostoc sp.]|uniref:hypothetical protein n=1 Tax=Nostoc sp. TaxID=1180 RepID=UPI002FF6E199
MAQSEQPVIQLCKIQQTLHRRQTDKKIISEQNNFVNNFTIKLANDINLCMVRVVDKLRIFLPLQNTLWF